MLKAGVSEESLKRIHAPIGVPIATDTPEEIAVSIMVEIIDVRRQSKKKMQSGPKAESTL
jgi:xanthine dehydrogenase accessory factor